MRTWRSDIACQRRVHTVPLSDASKISSTRLGTSLLVTVLVLTMALGAFPIVGTAVVATALANDLNMSLTMFGASVGVNTVVGALCAPPSGVFSDRYGGKWSCVLVLLSSGIGLLIVAVANSIQQIWKINFRSSEDQSIQTRTLK